MRPCYLLLVLLILRSVPGLSQDFRVQAAAFAKPVDLSYFTDRGVANVITSRDQNDIYRYFVGAYATRELAEVVQQQLLVKGFRYAAIIDLEEQRALGGALCPYYSDQQIFVQQESARNIFFDLGKSELTPAALEDLNEIAVILRQHPEQILNVQGYTDNVGDAQANVELATARARTARDYLITKGIKADRMFIKIYGEAEAGMDHRDFDGTEILENRKWNRRVALVVSEADGEVK